MTSELTVPILIIGSCTTFHFQCAIVSLLSQANVTTSPLRLLIAPERLIPLKASMYEAMLHLESTNVILSGSPPLLDHLLSENSNFVLANEAISIVYESSEIKNLEAFKLLCDRLNVRIDVSSYQSNYLELKSFKNSYRGETGVLICTGPSLLDIPQKFLEKHPTIGCNKLFLLDKKYFFRPNFLVVEDRLIIDDHMHDFKNYEGSKKIFPYDFFEKKTDCCFYPVVRSYVNSPHFSDDFCQTVYTGFSVLYIMLQFASYLGWKNIILVGVDGYKHPVSQGSNDPVVVSNSVDHNHFDSTYYGYGKRFHIEQKDKVLASYRLANFELKRNGINIINCSPGSMIDCFETGNYLDW